MVHAVGRRFRGYRRAAQSGSGLSRGGQSQKERTPGRARNPASRRRLIYFDPGGQGILAMKHAAAILGLGFVGRAHLDALRRLAIPVHGGLGSSPERTVAACKTLGIEKAYSSLDEIAADSSVTVVHVCTPNYLHFEQSSRLLRAGKHILCEKPLALDSRESAMLAGIAKESSRVGAVAYNLRYYPLCQEARSLLGQGAVGQPRIIHGSFLQDWLLYPSDWNWRLDPKLGGELRAVSDIGTHWLDLLMWLVGKKIT